VEAVGVHHGGVGYDHHVAFFVYGTIAVGADGIIGVFAPAFNFPFIGKFNYFLRGIMLEEIPETRDRGVVYNGRESDGNVVT
jgi:hypothetical protein